MPPRRKPYLSKLCDIAEVEEMCEKYSREYDLVGISAFQVGIGFGAKVNVLLVWNARHFDK